jgi:NADH-quinone oxidoreductase subunit L
LRWIPLVPLIGAILHITVGARLGRQFVNFLACAVVAVSFAFSLRAVLDLAAAGSGALLLDDVYTWIAAGGLTVNVAFAIDQLSAVMCMIVTGVGFLIHVYSTGYMSHDDDYARFFGYLNLFTAAMLVLVLADSLPVMFVGWEGVGLCSYLLIGFWYEDPAKASAGKKAFVVNRIGDAGFLLGMFVLFWAGADAGSASLRFADVNALAPGLPEGVAALAALLLFVGATGKSAQIPLFVWLPDAMAGPTPVSALIHAATMVTAGIYMVARLNAVYLAAPWVMDLIATIGALTAFGAATVAIVQNDIKKVLAYSTVSQLGYMFLALGVGAFGAAVFHVMTHAFFKALLFLGAGSVIHSLHEEQDIRNMGGLRAKMPITWITFGIGTAAIAGVPFLSGFFSKDEILASTFDSGHWLLWGLGVITAGMTAFYMTRLFVLTFHGEYRGVREKFDGAEESPLSMTSVLTALAVLATLGGYLGVPAVLGGDNLFAHYLEPVVGHHQLHMGHAEEIALMLISVAIALTGIFVARRLYASGPGHAATLSTSDRGLRAVLSNAYYVDTAYDRGIVAGIGALAQLLWRFVDVVVIDGLANGLARATQTLAGSWRQWSTGNVQHYAFSVLIGVAMLVVAVALGVAR